MANDTYLSTYQLARMFGVCPRTAAKWCDEGQIRHHKLPLSGMRRIAVKDAQVFATQHGIPWDPRKLPQHLRPAA